MIIGCVLVLYEWDYWMGVGGLKNSTLYISYHKIINKNLLNIHDCFVYLAFSYLHRPTKLIPSTSSL